ncbi:hypothetical protein Mgra_00001563 [Meloidogyne graminicola]|uniref:Uncharacterized protein n=1 Tax=Meloidogyne graminicola TaxID=189291 RepID=A0A8T0A160_9BILA|nr:hypothetical protein Mgra_00001563 [Meloidogyne graminicola]
MLVYLQLDNVVQHQVVLMHHLVIIQEGILLEVIQLHILKIMDLMEEEKHSNEYSYNMDSSYESSGSSGYDKSYKKSKYKGNKYNSYGKDNNYENNGYYSDSYSHKTPSPPPPPSYNIPPPPNYLPSSYSPSFPNYPILPPPQPSIPSSIPSQTPLTTTILQQQSPLLTSPLPSPQLITQTSQSSYPLPPMPSTIIYSTSPTLTLPSTTNTNPNNILPQLSNEFPQIIGNKIIGTTTPSLYQGLYQPLNGKSSGLISNGGLLTDSTIGSFDNSASLLALPPSVSPSQDFLTNTQQSSLNPSITSYPPNGPFIINLSNGGLPSGYKINKKLIVLNKAKEKNVALAGIKTLKKEEVKSLKDLKINNNNKKTNY